MSRLRYFLGLFSAVFFLLFSGVSDARDVYLNGQKINGLTGKTFHNVTVRIDEKGNIYIIGKQYQVVVLDGNKKGELKRETKQPAKIAKERAGSGTIRTRVPPSEKYILLVQRSVVYGSGYKLIVYINGKRVLTVPLSTPQDAISITKYLQKGPNTVEIEAIKEKRGAAGKVELLIAKGEIRGGEVIIRSSSLLKYERKGSDEQNYKHILSLNVE